MTYEWEHYPPSEFYPPSEMTDDRPDGPSPGEYEDYREEEENNDRQSAEDHVR